MTHQMNDKIKNIINRDLNQCWLKLVSAIFYQIFIVSPNDSPSKAMKIAFYFI